MHDKGHLDQPLSDDRALLLSRLPEKTVDWWLNEPLMSLQKRTPLEALESGDADQVLNAARGLLER